MRRHSLHRQKQPECLRMLAFVAGVEPGLRHIRKMPLSSLTTESSAIRTLNARPSALELVNAATIAFAKALPKLWSNYGPAILSQCSETAFGSCHGRGRGFESRRPRHFKSST